MSIESGTTNQELTDLEMEILAVGLGIPKADFEAAYEARQAQLSSSGHIESSQSDSQGQEPHNN